MSKPLVSVIITTYNRPDFLRKAIDSVIYQKFDDEIEIIVVNDCGEDLDWIEKEYWGIKYIKHEINKGLGAARNTGLAVAEGKYINFLDDDDIFYPHHIDTLVDFMEENNYEIAYTDAVCEVSSKNSDGSYYVTNRVIPYSIDYDPDMLLYQNITPVLCVMFKMTDEIKKIKLDETARVYEDWLYWLELTKFYDMHHLAIPTCKYTFRQDGSTMSSSRNEFTTMLPGIYQKTWERAKNKVQVCNIMNSMLQQRGYNPMFQIQSAS